VFKEIIEDCQKYAVPARMKGIDVGMAFLSFCSVLSPEMKGVDFVP
jgi:hypothetical protein